MRGGPLRVVLYIAYRIAFSLPRRRVGRTDVSSAYLSEFRCILRGVDFFAKLSIDALRSLSSSAMQCKPFYFRSSQVGVLFRFALIFQFSKVTSKFFLEFAKFVVHVFVSCFRTHATRLNVHQ